MGKNSPGYNEIRKARYAAQKALKVKADPKVAAPKVAKAKKPTLDQRLKAEVATKRLRGALKVHGATPKEIEKVIEKRATEKVGRIAPPPKTAAASVTLAKAVEHIHEDDDEVVVRTPKAPKTKAKRVRGVKAAKVIDPDKTMGRSYQRGGTVASGLTIKGGGQQVTCTFTQPQALWLGKQAAANGVSFAEQVRRAMNVAMDHAS